jgi:hypothetical protein
VEKNRSSRCAQDTTKSSCESTGPGVSPSRLIWLQDRRQPSPAADATRSLLSTGSRRAATDTPYSNVGRAPTHQADRFSSKAEAGCLARQAPERARTAARRAAGRSAERAGRPASASLPALLRTNDDARRIRRAIEAGRRELCPRRRPRGRAAAVAEGSSRRRGNAASGAPARAAGALVLYTDKSDPGSNVPTTATRRRCDITQWRGVVLPPLRYRPQLPERCRPSSRYPTSRGYRPEPTGRT